MLKKACSNGLVKDAIISRSICIRSVRFSHDHPSNGDGKTTTNEPKSAGSSDGQIPAPPTNCCMSGCANCVWIDYAEQVSSKLRGGSDVAREIIMKEVQDTNMRSFLEMELRMLKSKEPK